MAAPVVGNNAVALAEEVQQLLVPIVRAQWPTVMKDEGLRLSRAPILVEDLHAVFGRDDAHVLSPFELPVVLVSASMNGAKMEHHERN